MSSSCSTNGGWFCGRFCGSSAELMLGKSAVRMDSCIRSKGKKRGRESLFFSFYDCHTEYCLSFDNFFQTARERGGRERIHDSFRNFFFVQVCGFSIKHCIQSVELSSENTKTFELDFSFSSHRLCIKQEPGSHYRRQRVAVIVALQMRWGNGEKPLSLSYKPLPLFFRIG